MSDVTRDRQDDGGRPWRRPGDYASPPPVPASETAPDRYDPEPAEDHVPDRDDIDLGGPRGSSPLLGLLTAVAPAVVVLALGGWALPRTATPDPTPLLRATDVVFWALALVAVAVAAGGAVLTERAARIAAKETGHSRAPEGAAIAWLLPTTATIGSVLLIATYHNLWVMLIGAVVVALAGLAALLARDLFEDLTDSAMRVAGLVHGLVIHVVAFVTLAMIYANKLPDWLAALAVGLVATALLLESLLPASQPLPVRLGTAALGGLVLAQAGVAIDWWPTWGWTGGIALLVVFFLVNGLLQTWATTGEVARRDVGYYAGIGVAGLAAVVVLGL